MESEPFPADRLYRSSIEYNGFVYGQSANRNCTAHTSSSEQSKSYHAGLIGTAGADSTE